MLNKRREQYMRNFNNAVKLALLSMDETYIDFCKEINYKHQEFADKINLYKRCFTVDEMIWLAEYLELGSVNDICKGRGNGKNNIDQ